MLIFALGGIWFWMLLFVAFCTIVGLIENEYDFGADFVFMAVLAILYFAGCREAINGLLNWIGQHPLLSIGYFISYFVAGTAYSILKWYLYLTDTKQRIVEKGKRFYKDNFSLSRNKKRITHWMIYWPISGMWTLISNPIVKIFNRIFYKISFIYENLSNRIMGSLEEGKVPKK